MPSLDEIRKQFSEPEPTKEDEDKAQNVHSMKLKTLSVLRDKLKRLQRERAILERSFGLDHPETSDRDLKIEVLNSDIHILEKELGIVRVWDDPSPTHPTPIHPNCHCSIEDDSILPVKISSLKAELERMDREMEELSSRINQAIDEDDINTATRYNVLVADIERKRLAIGQQLELLEEKIKYGEGVSFKGVLLDGDW
jgi:predicted nuclease with TOPRIM domain